MFGLLVVIGLCWLLSLLVAGFGLLWFVAWWWFMIGSGLVLFKLAVFGLVWVSWCGLELWFSCFWVVC